jgi:hypothetical protein
MDVSNLSVSAESAGQVEDADAGGQLCTMALPEIGKGNIRLYNVVLVT